MSLTPAVRSPRRLVVLAQELGGPLLDDLTEDEARELARSLVTKVWGSRARIPGLATKVAASLVKQTADRLERGAGGDEKIGRHGTGGAAKVVGGEVAGFM